MNIFGMIHSMPLTPFLVITSVFIGMTGLAVFVGIRSLRIAKAIANTPTSKIADATPGYVEFEGTVDEFTGVRLKAPLTGWPCCWYKAKVEEYRRNLNSSSSSSNSYSWHTVEEATSSEPFICKDESGICAILPNGANITCTDRSVWYGADKTPTDRNPEKHGPGDSAEGMLRIAGTPNKKFKYTEERIYKNDPLFVLGYFENESEDDEITPVTSNVLTGGYNGKLPFIISTTEQQKLMEMNQLGSKAAFAISLLPLSITFAMIWFRLG